MYGGYSDFSWLQFYKPELKQSSDKPLFYAVLGVLVDVSVFKGILLAVLLIYTASNISLQTF